MDKPLTVARQEFTEKIVDVINSANLPAFVVAEVLQKCVVEIENIAKQQYEMDKKQYEASLKKENN